MRLNLRNSLPSEYNKSVISNVVFALETAVNLLSEGRQVATYNATTAAPTTGSHALGDFVLNSAPSELGGGGSKYIIHGWRCTVAGTPGTWVQCRFLTGN